MPMSTTEDCLLHRLTNTSSKHALVQVHKQTQEKCKGMQTPACRTSTSALQSTAGMKEH